MGCVDHAFAVCGEVPAALPDAPCDNNGRLFGDAAASFRCMHAAAAQKKAIVRGEAVRRPCIWPMQCMLYAAASRPPRHRAQTNGRSRRRIDSAGAQDQCAQYVTMRLVTSLRFARSCREGPNPLSEAVPPTPRNTAAVSLPGLPRMVGMRYCYPVACMRTGA